MSVKYWTLEKCKKSALNFSSKIQWKKGQSSAYSVALKNKWLDLCCAHMDILQKPKGYWTLERCQQEALKFNSKNEWHKSGGGSYDFANKQGWIDQCCSHMEQFKKPHRYWTFEKCLESAKKFRTKTEWQKSESSAYNVARNKGWLDKCFLHMDEILKPRNYWTLELCKESASNYTTRSIWAKSDLSAFSAAKRNGWIEECYKHMKELQKPHKYWNLERCKESALKFNNRKKWFLYERSAYSSARLNGWLDECCKHMSGNKKWTHKSCKESALKFKTKSDWFKYESGSFNYAIKNNLFEECILHMESDWIHNYWTLDKCKESALNYNTRTEWKKADRKAYHACIENKWIKECCGHMHLLVIHGYWTLERCKEEALKFESRVEWKEKSRKSYSAAQRHKWLNICSKHMIRIGDFYKRCIYVYEFPDNHAYVGLTHDIKERHRNRMKTGTDQVNIYMKKTGLEPILKILTEFLPVEEAANTEIETIKKYRKNGWIMLNISSGGGIGGKRNLNKNNIKYAS